MDTYHEKLNRFSFKVSELLIEKVKNDSIILSPNEISNYLESVRVGKDGEWGYYVNASIQKKIPKEISDEINELWKSI